MHSRETIRLYWEAVEGADVPEGGDLVEENWTPYWKESLNVVRVTTRIALVPAWERQEPEAPCALRIDPGMAFGAGDHPTTRLCLRALEAMGERGELPSRALDVGTGTGVLALAAARLGSREVDALDIDPFGFAACRRNALLNDLGDTVRPLLLSLDLLGDTYPLVAANVVTTQLLSLAPWLGATLEPEGSLLLSGFPVEEEPRILDAVRRELAVESRQEEDGWVALLLRK